MLIRDLVIDIPELYDPVRLSEADMNRRGLLRAMTAAAAMTAAGVARADDVSWDDSGRPVIAVSINGSEPASFILDTGANRTCVTQRFAQSKRLPQVGTRTITTGNGREEVPVVNISSLSGDGFNRTDVQAVVIPNNALDYHHQGLIGGDSFQGAKLVINMREDRYHVEPSGVADGFTAVQGEFIRNTILIFPVRVANDEYRAMLDTGGEGVYANQAFVSASNLASIPVSRSQSRVTGASGRSATAQVSIPFLYLGGRQFTRVTAYTAPLPILGEQPGLVIGMDMLRSFGTIAIDYGAAQLHLPTR